MTQYTATARRTGGFWTIQCDQYPGAISQVRRLDQAAEVHREAIAFVADVDQADVDVEVHPVLDDEVRAALDQAKTLHDEAEAAERLSRAQRWLAAQTMKGAGLGVRDIGVVLDVSFQRAQQILQTTEVPTP